MNNETLKQDWLAMGCPLTMEAGIVEIRRDIEQGMVPKREKRTLMIAAYNEMRRRQGKTPKAMDCGSCVMDLNKQMNIWLKIYDRRTEDQSRQCADEIIRYAAALKAGLKKPGREPQGKKIMPKPLPPLRKGNDAVKPSSVTPPPAASTEVNKEVSEAEARYRAMEFNDLLDLVKTLPQESQDYLNQIKTRNHPKKSDIIIELLGQPRKPLTPQ